MGALGWALQKETQESPVQISAVKGRHQISDSDVGLRWQEITLQTVLEWTLSTSAVLGQAAMPGHTLPDSLL